MKNLFKVLFVSIAFIIAGSSSEQQGHSHGEGADHTHEIPAAQTLESEDDTHSHGDEEHSH